MTQFNLNLKLVFIRLSAHNSVFIVNRRNNRFLCASTVLDGEELMEPHHGWVMPMVMMLWRNLLSQ